MPATMLRINERTHENLRKLSAETHLSMQEVADKAIEAYRRQQIFERTNAVYATMHLSPQVWQEELDERAAWHNTLPDGLGDS